MMLVTRGGGSVGGELMLVDVLSVYAGGVAQLLGARPSAYAEASARCLADPWGPSRARPETARSEGEAYCDGAFNCRQRSGGGPRLSRRPRLFRPAEATRPFPESANGTASGERRVGQGAVAMGLREQSMGMGARSPGNVIHCLPFSFDRPKPTTLGE